MIFNELGFTIGTVFLAALVAVVFFLQIRAVSDDSYNASAVTAAAQTAATLSSVMMEDALFERQVADGADDQTAPADARKQRYFEALERTRHNVNTANGRAIIFKLISRTGAVHSDSSAADRHGHIHRPFARLSDSATLDAIIGAADSSETGGAVEYGDISVAHACRVPGFPSYVVMAELV